MDQFAIGLIIGLMIGAIAITILTLLSENPND
jgi:hypothetical protein